MSATPVRIQLSRRKGFDLQEASRAVNSLEAVNVARPSKWGNPYHVDDTNMWWCKHLFGSRERTQGCVDHYERAIRDGFVLVPYTALTPEKRGDKYHSSGAHYVHEVAPKYLAGKNLACWCALDAPCHADVLLAHRRHGRCHRAHRHHVAPGSPRPLSRSEADLAALLHSIEPIGD